MSARSALVSRVVAYNLKVWVAGLAATAFVPLSLVALGIDLVLGSTGPSDSLSRRVLAVSARFEAWVNIHDDLTDVQVTGEALPA